MPRRKVKLFKRPVYALVKNLAVYSFRIFFREKVILHPEHLKMEKPTILVSNHPSTLLDPLHVGIEIKEYIHFLINAGMVQHWFTSWFFNTFFCIPIARAKDTGDRKVNNAESFAKANQFLSEKGVFFVAPEGGSKMERRLHPLKTGVARIALSAEAENNFDLDLHIQPFGLNYTDQRTFRSAIVLHCGAPFSIKKYQEAYEKKPKETVRALTAELAEHMRPLLIDTQDEEQDQFLRELGEMAQAKEMLSLKNQYLRSQKNLVTLKKWRKEDEKAYEQSRESSQSLSQKLAARHSDQQALYASGNGTLAAKNSGKVFRLIVELPFFIYGWFNNLLANYIPGFLARKLKLYPGYDSTVKILSGILLYPIIYGLQLFLVQWYFGNWWITLIYFLTLYPLGILAWNYRQRFLKWKKERRMIAWQKNNPEEVQRLFQQQKELLEKL